MPLEIEHKFLLANDEWRQHIKKSVYYKQGYLSSTKQNSIRIRISDTHAWINIKSAVIGTHRLEYEYEIPLSEANEILEQLCHKPLIEKKRHFVAQDKHTWEIDEFLGANQGLVVAEIELSSLDEEFHKPSWLGKEVTHDLRYYNNNLCKFPYRDWPIKD
ncbi:CYTH domain-containing protein [Methylomarinum vadi]|uniref:CYTH domain-containing protein n=1 Tax=Methylomarinum vadi TaxID=438855 RepID=UPI0004DF242B|nr:CYTH domain-containing protein [Methylomarinum vadi]